MFVISVALDGGTLMREEQLEMNIYDPEKRLENEAKDNELQVLIENFSMDQSTKDSFLNIAKCLRQHSDDFDNCFNPDEKEKLRLEGLKMVQDLKDISVEIDKELEGNN